MKLEYDEVSGELRKKPSIFVCAHCDEDSEVVYKVCSVCGKKICPCCSDEGCSEGDLRPL